MEPQSRQLDSFYSTPSFGGLASEYKHLRVLLDARKLGHGGIGMYIENLINGFLELGVELTVVGQRSALLRFGLLDYVGIIDDDAKQYSINELFFLSRRINQSQFDVFHSPHFTLPYGLKIPTVVTVHDLIHVRQPERFYYPYVAAPLIRSALRRATRVLTVSDSSRADILSLMGEGNFHDKICVVPNAVDPVFGARAAEGRAKPYLLAVVSNSKPHKGLPQLIEGFQKVMASELSTVPKGLKLMVVGEGAQGLVDMHGSIITIGHVSKERLARLYREAMAVVVPSRAEGFCLPALEAHASGTPVIATPVAAVQEILSEGDVECPGFAPADIATGIIRFLEAPRAHQELTQRRSSDWQERYSRAQVARRVLDVYGQAVSGEAAK
ncbi:MAG: glycosyltransferase family 4 protein [Deltaproteobacteria bacterium]|nr:glycosyltransferase family 4 protein [Deltaproteobacteria bacterium]